MNPIRRIQRWSMNRRLQRQQSQVEMAFAAKVDAFRQEVDTYARVFRLDPELSELTCLKSQAPELLRGFNGDGMGRLNLSWLNPHDDISKRDDGTLVIHERMLGHVLMPWTLAEFHLGKEYLSSSGKRITVDINGTHIFSEFGRLLVTYQAGVLNPHRAADPGNRVRNAIAFVEHFTELKLELDEMWQFYAAEFTLTDGEWTASYQREPTLVS